MRFLAPGLRFSRGPHRKTREVSHASFFPGSDLHRPCFHFPVRPDKSLLATLDDGLFDVRNAVGSLHDYVKLRAQADDTDEFAHLDGACALIMARLGALLEAVEVAAHE